LRCGDAFDDDAFGFKVGDPVVGTVTHGDRFFEECDERAGGLGEPAVGGLVPVDGEVVGGVTLWAGEGLLEDAGEGADAELADGVGTGADGCDSQVHLLDRLSLGIVGFGFDAETY
jgi:hypothetical protein